MKHSHAPSFSERLKALMSESGVSQADLVKADIISKSYLSGILSAKHPPPDVSIIKGICRVLGVDAGMENELILLAGREFEHIIANEAAADFLRKTVADGWDENDWQRHNQLVDIAIRKNDK